MTALPLGSAAASPSDFGCLVRYFLHRCSCNNQVFLLLLTKAAPNVAQMEEKNISFLCLLTVMLLSYYFTVFTRTGVLSGFMSVRNFSSSHLDPATSLFLLICWRRVRGCVSKLQQLRDQSCQTKRDKLLFKFLSLSLLCLFVTEICFRFPGTCAARMCPLAP